MNVREIILIFTTIVLYIIVIEKTIRLYLFPEPDLSIIFQDFRQHALSIKIIFVLIVSSLIPIFFHIKKEFNEVKLKKVPLGMVLWLSAIFTPFAFVNNYFTGDLLFSAALILYGVLFAAVASRFR